MSQRLNVYGFDLGKIKSLFGSRDENALKEIATSFNKLHFFSGSPDDFLEEHRVFETFQKIIMSDSFEEDSDNEPYLYDIMFFLSRYRQDNFATSLLDWKINYLYGVIEAISGKIDVGIYRLLNLLLTGRNISGEWLDGAEQIYGYFTKEEVKSLLDYLRSNFSLFEPDDSGFWGNLEEALAEVAEKKCDLWFNAI